MPYTLPGVLALISWWWYISRKKERLIIHDSQEGAPTAMGLRSSLAEGSNGLVEKHTVSPTNDTECPTHIPPKVSNQTAEHENISQVHVQDTEAKLLCSSEGVKVPSLEQSSNEGTPHLVTVTQKEVHKPSLLTLPSPGKEYSLQVSLKDHKDPEKSSSPALVKELEKHLGKDPATVEEAILPHQSTKVTCSSSTTADLSDAERPEPEGEVAEHLSTVNAQDDMVVCAVTPAKVQRVIPSEAVSLETPPSAQDFHQHILTSTPTFPALTTIQDATTTSVTPEDFDVHNCSGEDQDLELLASGLITEVISAATKEILGVTSCQVTDNSQPSCSSSTTQGSGRLCSQQEPSTAAQQLLTSPSQIGCESREAADIEEQVMPNGCSLLSRRAHQTNSAQRGHWPTSSHQAAQSVPLLNVKLKGDEPAVLTEDSACSTCHSEDGITNEDLQNSIFDNQMDVIQVTDLSPREATQPQSLVETATEARVLTETDKNSLDAVCEMKRLNGMGMRNGAHGICEVETDQSGGETSICSICFLV